MIQKFTIARSPEWYNAWPDAVIAADGRLVCAYSECRHHHNRSYTRAMITESFDRGRTWGEPRPLTEPGTEADGYFYNNTRICRLPDNRLAVSLDQCRYGKLKEEVWNHLYFSGDNGVTWDAPVRVPLEGIVPEKLTVLDNGRWLYAAHREKPAPLTEYLIYSDDQGKTWSKEIAMAHRDGLNLCEVSLIPLGDGIVVGLLRENSYNGWDCQKVISRDNGETWSEPVAFPLPGCHRPSGGLLADGRVLITYRFHHGGSRKYSLYQNFFAALTDRESLLAESRDGAGVRIMPLDYDRSPHPDTGYSGWVQFPDGELYAVNYLLDDWPRGQIRGYSFGLDDFILP